MEEALERGNGALLFTGHVGSFSSAVPALGHKGFALNLLVNNSPEESTLHPAYRHYAQMKLRLMEKATGRKFIYFNLGRDDHSLAHAGVLTLSKLRRNELVVIALDVPPHYFRHTAEVSFLGQLCRFPCGYLDLAYKTGSAVLPFVTVRKDGCKDKPEIRVFEPINLSGDAVTDLQTCLDRLSETIKEYPSQWYYWDSLAHFVV